MLCLFTYGVTTLDNLTHQKKKRVRRRKREVVPRLSPLFTLFNWVNLCQLYMLLSLTSSVVSYLTPTSSHSKLKLSLLCTSLLVMVYLKVLEYVCWASLTGCFILISRAVMPSLVRLRSPALVIIRLLSGLLWKRFSSQQKNINWDTPKSSSGQVLWPSLKKLG